MKKLIVDVIDNNGNDITCCWYSYSLKEEELYFRYKFNYFGGNFKLNSEINLERIKIEIYYSENKTLIVKRIYKGRLGEENEYNERELSKEASDEFLGTWLNDLK